MVASISPLNTGKHATNFTQTRPCRLSRPRVAQLLKLSFQSGSARNANKSNSSASLKHSAYAAQQPSSFMPRGLSLYNRLVGQRLSLRSGAASATQPVGRRRLVATRIPMLLKNTCALVVGLPLLIIVVAIAIWQRSAQTNQLNIFHSLDRQSVSSIMFYEARLSSSDPLATIDNSESLTAFVVAARDMRRHSAGKLSATEAFQKWRVVVHLSNGADLELTWSHRGRFPEEVHGKFVRTTPNSLLNLGGFRSRELRAWFTKYVAVTTSGQYPSIEAMQICFFPRYRSFQSIRIAGSELRSFRICFKKRSFKGYRSPFKC